MNGFSELGPSFIGWIPNLAKAIIIFIIGWLLSLLIAWIVKKILIGAGLNRKFEESSTGSFVRRITDNPARTISRFIFWLLMIITITIVIGALRIPVFSDLIFRIYTYVPNILAAILILAGAIALAAFIGVVVHRWMGDTPTGKIASTAAPAIILSIAVFAVLEQLRIAPSIVLATYIALIGSLALGFALAFGLGARDVAARLFDEAYRRGPDVIDRAKRYIEKGQDRAKEDINRVKRKYSR